MTGEDALAVGDDSGGPGVLGETLIGALGALIVLAFVFASFLALLPLVVAAVANWQAAGIGPAQVDLLQHVQVHVADLPGPDVGLAFPNTLTIYVDRMAGGYGWFIDPTPGDASEFQASPTGTLEAWAGSPAAGP